MISTIEAGICQFAPSKSNGSKGSIFLTESAMFSYGCLRDGRPGFGRIHMSHRLRMRAITDSDDEGSLLSSAAPRSCRHSS